MWGIPKFTCDDMVYACFRDARRDIRDPPEAQSARASPYPHNEEYLDARPDQDEMEDAINQFLVQLEKQEKKGFKDMASVLSQLPNLAQGSVSSISVADAIEAGFFQHWIKIRPICSLRRSFACPDTLRTTGKTGISLDIPG